MRLPTVSFALLLVALIPSHATLHVVAAENFYGLVAKQIGGAQVEVTSILSNPDQDPHLFTVDPKTAMALARADVVIESGIDYDPWMEQLDASHPRQGRATINVASLIDAKTGQNPHIWYRPDTLTKFAIALTKALVARDLNHRMTYESGLAAFQASLGPVRSEVAVLKSKFGGTDVLATEPVFGYMADALGFRMHAMDFQNHVMNNVEPTARETEDFETLLRQHKVKLLFYNSQASDPIADRMKELAKASGIPVIGVTETEPAGTTFATWMLSQLDQVEKALQGSSK